ncbi:hypothetical protein SAMN02799622_00033 [Methylobacterium sp. UNC378MF]|uniref:hypothetical protein n=1 Tax=Methylobacterium sp. UNC378MF TaxID=1502748 RepID=UPI00089025EA|nr:hypothetical protein [Methylobacterium sp. UNC378MF]SDA09261.1 hypothetical protein SAMN02799622_00033 [Methylobacterium sp. UNC378MF]
MKPSLRGAAGLLLAGPLCLSMVQRAPAAPGGTPPAPAVPAQTVPAAPAPVPTPEPGAAQATGPVPAAGPSLAQPCGTQAARFESGKGFKMVITRAGQINTTNPLRPLTPEVNEVLQVVIAGKVATAYGPDFTTLRRGGAPAGIEAMLGGPIHWQPTLPTFPDPVAIVTEDGMPLAQLTFRACEAPPAVKTPKVPKAEPRKKAPRHAAPKAAAEKTPPGFSMPQGAISE